VEVRLVGAGSRVVAVAVAVETVAMDTLKISRVGKVREAACRTCAVGRTHSALRHLVVAQRAR